MTTCRGGRTGAVKPGGGLPDEPLSAPLVVLRHLDRRFWRRFLIARRQLLNFCRAGCRRRGTSAFPLQSERVGGDCETPNNTLAPANNSGDERRATKGKITLRPFGFSSLGSSMGRACHWDRPTFCAGPPCDVLPPTPRLIADLPEPSGQSPGGFSCPKWRGRLRHLASPCSPGTFSWWRSTKQVFTN